MPTPNEELFTRVMPFSNEAEQSVLGAMFLDMERIPDVIEAVRADDFYLPRNKELFEAMMDIYSVGKPIDLVTLLDQLTLRGSLASIGGPDYILEVTATLPTTANVKHYVRIVEEKSTLRKLIRAAAELSDQCYSQTEEVETVLELAERSIFDITQSRLTKGFTHIKTLLGQNLDKLAELADHKTETTGVPTGFSDLDRITVGLQPSDLILVAARPAMGKSSFAINIAQHAAVKNRSPIALFTLEMSDIQVAARMLASEAMVSGESLKKGNIADADWGKLAEAIDVLSNSPIYIDDTSGISPAEIGAKCRRLKMEHGLGLVVIDYLQLMAGSRRTDNRQQEISEISRSLKVLAKDLNVPIIALSQLNRAPEARTNHRPMLSDLRESGAIEQDADIVMFLYRDDYYNEESEEPNTAECIIAKHRNGEVGTVKLAWIKEYTKFADLAVGY